VSLLWFVYVKPQARDTIEDFNTFFLKPPNRGFLFPLQAYVFTYTNQKKHNLILLRKTLNKVGDSSFFKGKAKQGGQGKQFWPNSTNVFLI